ncbi:hypothetical protein BOTBODRAFT_179019 [Botryobasidium botryosum FD-172 SS1]|uniref:Uncharacterized protein n=1 Tax=Botryobasidium botryosum (strain FD-172 SS1) TaxID=930990 RepID=A0A067MC62_BOTB1|nr:hypothetical protein BOTBODRAFT_179019 [Botryobasidium botryosum FD-172 SS1]
MPASSTVVGHKRKRSIRDTPVNLGEMRAAMKHLTSLKAELGDIQETEGEIRAIMGHARALQEILNNAETSRMNFSSVTKNVLASVGISRGLLHFVPDGINALLSCSPPANDQYAFLRSQLIEIYDHVNMNYDGGARMVFDAVLLAISKISTERRQSHGVAILPDMKLTPADGIMVENPVTRHKSWFTGCADYTLIQYLHDEGDNYKGILLETAARNIAFSIATAHLLVVYVKHRPGKHKKLHCYLPKAVSQAIAFGERTKQSEVRFCLSDGHSWIFAILKKDEAGNRTYYESVIKNVDKSQIKAAESDYSRRQIREIVELILYWLSPSEVVEPGQLYEFKGAAPVMQDD